MASRRRNEPVRTIAPQRYTASDRRKIRFFPDIFVLLLVAAILVASLSSFSIFASAPPASSQTPGSGGAVAAGLYINEVMSSNAGSCFSADGNAYDWIELINKTNSPINLQGYALSDDLKEPNKYVMPAHELDAGAMVIVFASGLTSNIPDGELHAPFKLSSKGEELLLSDNQGNQIDYVSFESLGTNMSYGRDTVDFNTWKEFDQATPGFPNNNEGYSAYNETRRVAGSPVYINEVMAANAITIKDSDGNFSDWVELYNSSSAPVNLKGYGLSDDENDPKHWEFGETIIQPDSYVIVFLSGRNRNDPKGELHASFKLNSTSDTVIFSSPQGQILQQVMIDNLQSDTSFGRVPGSDQWMVFTHPTPNYPNTEDGYNQLQPNMYKDETSGLLISEVMTGNSTVKDDKNLYPDWIELYNKSSAPIGLNGYGLSDDTGNFRKWTFPDVSIDPGEYLVVYADGTTADSAQTDKKKLHTNFNLSSTGNTLVLSDNNGNMLDRCMVPRLDYDMTYGRPSGNMMFQYITEPTPGGVNKNGYPGFAPQPIYSLKGGDYDETQSVELTIGDASNAKIVYTTDCKDPSEGSSKYSQAITVDKTTVIRARSYRDGYLPSPIATTTYLIKEDHDLPAISLVSDPANLNDPQTGINVAGPNASTEYPFKGANYNQDWERAAHMELFELDGTVGIDQGMGIRVFGAYSRAPNYSGANNDPNAKWQRSFALIANGKYGPSTFDYPVFSDLPYTEYYSLVVRDSAQDKNMSHIRDVLQTSLVHDTTNLDVQAYRDVVVYLNGEFWGVYHLREKINKDFIAQHYNVSPDSVDLLVGNYKVVDGSNADYKKLREYVQNNDMSVSANYEYVKTQMDVDNYIDYIICEIYTGNTDLGNIKFWRSSQYDNKWRWIFYDLDWGFFDYDDADSTLDSVQKAFNPEGVGVNNSFDNVLLCQLIKNPEFKQKFLERFAYHVNVTFETQRVLQRIDEQTASIEHDMARHKATWGFGTVDKWKSVQIEKLKEFAEKRPDVIKAQLKSYFNLSDSQMQQLFG